MSAEFDPLLGQLRTKDVQNLVLNVKDYGATGNGTTDDTTAINLAIAAASNGGIVYLPQGTYIVSSPLTSIAAGVEIRGTGGESALKLSGSWSGSEVINITNDNCAVRSLRFIGGSSTTASSNPAANMVEITAAQYCKVIDIYAQYCNGYIVEAKGNSTNGPLGLIVDNVNGLSNAYGIHTLGNSVSGYELEAVITNVNMQLVTTGDAFLIEDSYDVQLGNLNSSIYGSSASNASDIRIHGACASVVAINVDVGGYPNVVAMTPAILIESGVNGSPENIQIANGIVQAGSTGVSITGGSNLSITGIKAQRNATHGISVSGGTSIKIQHCIFGTNGQTAGTNYDIYVNTTNSDIEIDNCLLASPKGTSSGQVTASGYNISGNNATWQACDFRGVGFDLTNIFSGNPASEFLNTIQGDDTRIVPLGGNVILGTQGNGKTLKFWQESNGTAANSASIRADFNNLYLTNANGYVVIEDATNQSHALHIQESGSPFQAVDWWFDGQSGTGTGVWMQSGFNAGNINMKVNGTGGAFSFNVVNLGNASVFSVDSNGNVTMSDGANASLGTTTGTKIGTATNQKLAFFNATPIVQPSGNIATALSNLGLVSSPTVTPTGYTQTSAVTVANTVTESTLLSSGVGSLTLPANFLVTGKTVKITVAGVHSATANPNITINIKLGSTTVMTTGIVTSGNSTNAFFEIHGFITCYTTGATGTVWAEGYYVETGGGTGRFSMGNSAATTIDTTASQTINVTATWGTASTSNTITASVAMVEFVN